MSLPRIVLVADQLLLLDGLRRLLKGHGEIVAAVEDGEEAVRAALTHKPDLILLDISMPGMNGYEVARRLKPRLPECKIIFLTMHADPLYATEAFQAGGEGFISKRAAAPELLQAIQLVLHGRPYITAGIVKEMLAPLLAGGMQTEVEQAFAPVERDAMRLISLGFSATEIANELSLPLETVVSGISRIIKVFGLPVSPG